MLIKEPVRYLGPVASGRLTDEVLAMDEAAWLADPERQNSYSVHAQTRSIVLSFCDGWPKVRFVKREVWSQLGGVATEVIEEVVRSWYAPGGMVLRTMLAKLPAGCVIPRHRDVHPSFSVAHRIHVPLVTNEHVEFIVGDERVSAVEHSAFEINNCLPHEVANRGQADRIHFIFDYAPKAG